MRVILLSIIVIVVILCPTLSLACTERTQTIVQSVDNLCQVLSDYNNAGSSPSVDDGTTVQIQAGGTLVMTVVTELNPTNYYDFTDNDYWCHYGGPVTGTSTNTPEYSFCQFANGGPYLIDGFQNADTHGVGDLPAVAGSNEKTSVPSWPTGALVARIGSDSLANNDDVLANGYFQVFCNEAVNPYDSMDATADVDPIVSRTDGSVSGVCGTTAYFGGTYGNFYDYSTNSQFTSGPTYIETIELSSSVSGELYLCFWDFQSGNNYGSVHVEIQYTPPSTGVCGDPQFTGLRGQNYQIHGIDGFIYNIISDKTTQVNAKFTFLDGPRLCPIMPSTNRTSQACWSHPGSYLSEIGIVLSDGATVHIVSGRADIGFKSISINGNQSHRAVRQESTHEITIAAGPFVLSLENIDGFVNIRSVSLAYKVQMTSLTSHGLLGQTWNTTRSSGSVKEIQGEVDDYTVSHIFGIDFMFNQYTTV